MVATSGSDRCMCRPSRVASKQTRSAVSCGKFMPRSVINEIADRRSASLRAAVGATCEHLLEAPQGRSEARGIPLSARLQPTDAGAQLDSGECLQVGRKDTPAFASGINRSSPGGVLEFRVDYQATLECIR